MQLVKSSSLLVLTLIILSQNALQAQKFPADKIRDPCDSYNRGVRKLMLAHPAWLTAKSVLFDEEYTGLYSFSVAHT